MAKLSKADKFDIEKHTVSCDVSYRGGTLKVDVSELFPKVSNPVMGAYQNYLGGGDEYMQENVTGSEAGGYDKVQTLPVSGY